MLDVSAKPAGMFFLSSTWVTGSGLTGSLKVSNGSTVTCTIGWGLAPAAFCRFSAEEQAVWITLSSSVPNTDFLMVSGGSMMKPRKWLLNACLEV